MSTAPARANIGVIGLAVMGDNLALNVTCVWFPAAEFSETSAPIQPYGLHCRQRIERRFDARATPLQRAADISEDQLEQEEKRHVSHV